MASYYPGCVIAFIVLSYISFAISLAVCGLSLVDRGFESHFMNIVIPVLTAIYHIIILVSHHRFNKHDKASDHTGRRYCDHPAATNTSLACLFCLIVLWLLPFGFIISTPGTKSPTVRAQMALDSVETGFLSSLVGICAGLSCTAGKWVSLEDGRYVYACLAMLSC
jgi:hypothetical protein